MYARMIMGDAMSRMRMPVVTLSQTSFQFTCSVFFKNQSLHFPYTFLTLSRSFVILVRLS